MEITVGMKGKVTNLVEKEDTAQMVGSGSLLVYATPCMAALMEGAACEAIAEAIPEDQTTVGIELNLQHTAATPVGMEVWAEAEVTAVEGKIISFQIQAFDEAGQIISDLQRVGVWCEPMVADPRPIPSEPETETFSRLSRIPALRDSACQSVKGQQLLQFEWYRG